MTAFLSTTTKNFNGMAEGIADDYLTKGIYPRESVIKIAQDESFNPEEIRRLIEKTNTATTVKIIKVAKSKDAQIPLVDLSSVLKETHPSSNSMAKIASEPRGSMPSSLPRTIQDRTIEKVAFCTQDELVVSPPKENTAKKIFALERDIEQHRQAKLAFELKAQDAIDFVASEFSVWQAPSFSKFACEVLTLQGPMLAPVMSSLQAYLGGSSEPLEKVAYVIDNTTAPHCKVAELKEYIEGILKEEAHILKKKAELASTWKTVRGSSDDD